MEMADQRERIFTTTEEELGGIALGAHIDSQGVLQATSRIQLSEGGKIGRMLTQLKPVRINVLAGLPRGPFAFAVGSATLQPLIDLRLDAIERRETSTV